MKRIAKIIGKTLLVIVGLIGLYALTAWICAGITVNREPEAKEEVTIYIKTNGVHTDIVIPMHSEQMEWGREVLYANTAIKDTAYPWLALGWGDKGFYLQTPEWKDLKFSVAFNAAFGLSTTAMHATFYRQMTEGENCRKIMISREQYGRLINYINESFQHDAGGHFIKINTTANYGASDAFYEANGRYSMLYTCNTWANSALKKSGQKACLWTALDKGIFAKYE